MLICREWMDCNTRKVTNEGIKASIIMVSTLTTKMLSYHSCDGTWCNDFVTKPTNIIEAKGEEFKNQILSVLSAVHRTKVQL